MSIEALFNHECAIYHLIAENQSPGYGLPGAPTFRYPPIPDENGVSCHFTVKVGNNTSMTQNAPQNEFKQRTKLNLPIGTDIRLNDKIIRADTGLEYTVVTPPENIRENHITAYLERVEEQTPL